MIWLGVISLLTGYKKKLVKETISYFIDTTGLTSDNFILLVQRNNMKDEDTLGYNEWLAVKCFKMLKGHGISLADCLEFRNLAVQLKMEKRGINISPIWKKEIAKCIEETDISEFTLFEVSDSNSEFSYIDNAIYHCMGGEDENFNFFNTFDFDRNNPTFLRMLPNEVRKAILYKTPLFININTYLEKDRSIDGLLEYMKMYSYDKKVYKDILYASLFRVMKLCEDYELKDVRIGFYGSLDMFCEKPDYLPFYQHFKREFKFNKGVCFNPKSVGVKEKTDFIGYMIWDKKNGVERDIPVVLDEKIQHTEDTILTGAKRLFRGKRDSLYDWVQKGMVKEGDTIDIPVFLNLQTKSDKTVEKHSNVLGFQQNSKNLLRSLKKVGVSTVPIGEYTEITEQNLLKSVASFVVRSCLTEEIGYSTNPIYLSAPDMTIEGYQRWISDALVYFTFSPLNSAKSYRELGFKMGNPLFPLSFSEVHRLVTDENIINDMNTHSMLNLPFIQVLDECRANLSEDGRNFYNFCMNKVMKSLTGNFRENEGYKDSLVAWDAGFYQIRRMTTLFTPKEEERYNYLLSVLKDKLREGIYTYGFVSDIN